MSNVICEQQRRRSPAHPRSLISAFVVRCLDSVMSLVSVTKISSLMLASVAAQAGLCLAWSETPEHTFSHGEAHIYFMHLHFKTSDQVLAFKVLRVFRMYLLTLLSGNRFL